MDWVETTGKTIDEATSRALQHLGVALNDADIEIIEEPKTGFLGRVKGEARVRARVRPSGPRPKRSRRPNGRDQQGRSPRKPAENRAPKQQSQQQKPKQQPKAKEAAVTKQKENSPKGEKMAEGITLAEQGELAKKFLEGLLASMDLTATVSLQEIDAETIEVSINHEPPTELGVLVGPRGTTLQALQEVTRTYVQSKSPGRTDRIILDVAKYRERRVAALGRFGQQVAQEVIETGEERALEPMSPADRKAIHDALTGIDGIVTRSEGDEPRRFVVVAPA
jgi:spoIIIJ-associated protein